MMHRLLSSSSVLPALLNHLEQLLDVATTLPKDLQQTLISEIYRDSSSLEETLSLVDVCHLNNQLLKSEKTNETVIDRVPHQFQELMNEILMRLVVEPAQFHYSCHKDDHWIQRIFGQ